MKALRFDPVYDPNAVAVHPVNHPSLHPVDHPDHHAHPGIIELVI